MKKQRRNDMIQLVILVILGAAVVLSVVLPQLPHQDRMASLMELSVVIRESDSTLWSNVRLGMEAAAGDLGAELRFLTLSKANDSQEQANLLRREVEGGAGALVVVPADPQNLTEQWKDVADPCPLVCMESWMEGADAIVGPDNEELGRALAQVVLEDWTQGVVLLLDTGGSSTGVSQRLQAAKAELEENGVPVESRIASPGALPHVLSPLVEETGAVQIMAFESAATEQAVYAKENGTLPQPLYGVGISARVIAVLERGDVAAVAAVSDYAAGYVAAESAIHLARGEAADAEQLPFFVVRGEDIYDPENQKLLFPVT